MNRERESTRRSGDGFGLAKGDDEVYAVDFSQWYGPTCTCGDYEYRQRECKHIKAVRCAMHAAGITIPPHQAGAPVVLIRSRI
jgi:hypothetical protein